MQIDITSLTDKGNIFNTKVKYFFRAELSTSLEPKFRHIETAMWKGSTKKLIFGILK